MAQVTLQRMYPMENENEKFKEETITELLPVPHDPESYSDEVCVLFIISLLFN